MIGSLVEPNQRLLQQILSFLPIAVMVIDTSGKIVYFNLIAKHLSGYSQDEIVNRSCSQFDSNDCQSPCAFIGDDEALPSNIKNADGHHDGLIMIDHEYRIKAINKTQAIYLDMTSKDLVEKFCYQVIANRLIAYTDYLKVKYHQEPRLDKMLSTANKMYAIISSMLDKTRKEHERKKVRIKWKKFVISLRVCQRVRGFIAI
jgi:transcriptional regulator with PAS, ATPase and Fis domain